MGPTRVIFPYLPPYHGHNLALFLVHFGARPIFDYFPQKKKPCKLLIYKALSNEADEIRTRNHRIDSPVL